MKNFNENKELITALVDNELSQESRQQVIELINSNPDLNYDYKVQSLIKTIVQGVEFKPAPVRLRNKIIKKIRPKEKNKFEFLPGLFSRPVFAAGFALVLITAALLLMFNPTPQNEYNFAVEQQGEDNMFIQARSNYTAILQGKLSPQFTSDNASEIQKFFSSQGVKYNTIIPALEGYNLVGAVVSEDEGEKFAHHVYADNEGHLLYLFQVEESYIENNKIVKISKDLRSFLNDGNCYTYNEEGIATLMTKVESNIFAVVANIPDEKLENQFCNI